jgi:hypothetical protein
MAPSPTRCQTVAVEKVCALLEHARFLSLIQSTDIQKCDIWGTRKPRDRSVEPNPAVWKGVVQGLQKTRKKDGRCSVLLEDFPLQIRHNEVHELCHIKIYQNARRVLV